MKRTLILDVIISLVVVALLILVVNPYLAAFTAVGIILFYSHWSKGIKAELGFVRPANVGKTCLTALLLAIGALLVSYFVLMPVYKSLTGVPLSLGAFKHVPGNFNLLLMSIAGGWIVGGFIEEIVFRAFLITRFGNHLPKKLGLVLGAILTSAVFGYLHNYQGITGQLIVGTIGLMLATVFILNKERIWLNILTHGFINTFTFLALYFEIIKV